MKWRHSECVGLGLRDVRIQILILPPLSSSVKSLKTTEPQPLHLQSGDNRNTHLRRLLGEISEVIHTN